MFIEDKITRVRRKQTEVVMVSQFIPGDSITVKHDLYVAYDVTAVLKRYPIRRGDDIEYEVLICKHLLVGGGMFNVSFCQVQIAATDSEPQTNEDCRMVSHNEISLSGEGF